MHRLLALSKEYTQRLSHHIAESKHAEWLLALISFFESIIFPIPTDVFFAPLVVLRPKKWFCLALITTVSSVLGGITAYMMGYWLFQWLDATLFSWYDIQHFFDQIQVLFDRNVFTAMLISAVSFIPFKALAFAGGVFKAHIIWFVLGSLAGRSLRFFGEGYLISRYGEQVTHTIYRYWNWFVALVLLVLIGVVVYLVR